MASVNINVQLGSWIENRNGMPDISSLTVWDNSSGDVYLSAFNMRGREVRGGFRIAIEDMDKLATEWLKARGLLPASETAEAK